MDREIVSFEKYFYESVGFFRNKTEKRPHVPQYIT